ncbi:hypothetical protein T07_9520 [Trichinella nelsoni]|uniref:Uncharacterized protein n=1 Tax=Trichinella nelsoni TaxID=6336 RepID=A0A0V0S8R4_9BILA|nr:hypothetical protein T07_9520 [Trichinella nelsoni]
MLHQIKITFTLYLFIYVFCVRLFGYRLKVLHVTFTHEINTVLKSKYKRRKNQQESVVNRYGYNNMMRRLARRKSYWPVVLAVDGRAVVWFWFDLAFLLASVWLCGC